MFDFLSRTFSSFFSGFSSSVMTDKDVESLLKSVREALLSADVPLEVVDQFVAELQLKLAGQKVSKGLKPSEQVLKVTYDTVVHFLGGQSMEAGFAFQIPSTIMVVGLQGSGKTTSIAKLAHNVVQAALKRGKERRVLLASIDYYRPAAIDQLEILAKSVSMPFYRAEARDPVAAAVEIQAYAQKHGYELLFLDTAGRLHIDQEMLQELKSVDAKLKPKYKILVLDAMTGQQSLNVARLFDEAVGFSSAILSKMDSETRAGAAFAFRYLLKKPILFAGTGEKISDLEQFRPERIASRMLGMGDVATLVEQANEKIKLADQQAAYEKIMQGRLTLEDFAQQIDMVGRLGSLNTLLKYMPGGSSMAVTPDALEKGEQELKKFKAMIRSMTPKERVSPHIIDGPRKKRIALGAGVKPEDVTLLLSRFEQSQQFVKIFKKMGGINRLFKQ